MRRYSLLAVLIAFFTLSGCKSFKDSSVSRLYHDITSHYNIYFNANELLKEIISNTEDAHTDDYNDILDILRMGSESSLKGNSSSVDQIIKKCTKIFDKHKVSKWVDDTYLLAGKAYFYKADYYAAIEAFQYITSRYKKSDIAYEAMLWIIYSNLQLGKHKEALALITLLKSDKAFPNYILKDLMLVDAFVNIQDKDYKSALESLKKALPKERNRSYKTRYLFIYAQLLQATGQNKAASEVYKAVVKRNPRYEMAFNAKIEIARCVEVTDERSAREIKSILSKMLKDDKNLQYMDQIYFEMALIDFKIGNTKEAEKNLKLSIKSSKGNENQKALAYLSLAEYYFDLPDYQQSKAYFDSTGMFLSNTFSGYEEIMNKTKVVGELVKHYVTIEEQDSLLFLANVSPKVRDSIVQKAYEEEQRIKREEVAREKEKKLREEQEMRMNREEVRNNRMMSPGLSGSSLIGSSEWYFYNQSMKKMGEAEFKVKWGMRTLQDNWRLKSLSSNIGPEIPTQVDSTQEEEVVVEYEMNETEKQYLEKQLQGIPEYKLKYYENIPFTESQQKTSHMRIMLALKKIAEISAEEVHDTATAIWAYDQLASRYPGGKYNPLSHYQLYMFYDPLTKADQKQAHKDTILERYPESDYAILIKDPEYFRNQLRTQSIGIEALYDEAYKYYTLNDCSKLKEIVDSSDKEYPGNYKRKHFEYLYILCKGKKSDKDEFVKDLSTFVSSTNDAMLVAHAQNLIDYFTKKEEVSGGDQMTAKVDSFLQSSPFKLNEKGTHFFMFVFETRKVNTITLKTAFADYNAEYHQLDELSVATFIFDKTRQILIVKDFENEFKAQKYLHSMISDKDFLTKIKNRNPEFYIISQNNFATLLREQNLDHYKEFYKRYFK